MPFHGSCHCGNVVFSVDAELPSQALNCNCSHCRRKGMLLAFFPTDKFTLDSGEASLRSYKFNTHRIEHRFCADCGTQPFAIAVSPDGTPTRAVNLRCVPDIDLNALELQHYNGAAV